MATKIIILVVLVGFIFVGFAFLPKEGIFKPLNGFYGRFSGLMSIITTTKNSFNFSIKLAISGVKAFTVDKVPDIEKEAKKETEDIIKEIPKILELVAQVIGNANKVKENLFNR